LFRKQSNEVGILALEPVDSRECDETQAEVMKKSTIERLLMLTPKRFILNGAELVESAEGNLVEYTSFVELAAHAIEGAANKEFLDRQVPSLKKALVDILVIAASFDDAEMSEIKELAALALAQ
jgi:hypothetical protein